MSVGEYPEWSYYPHSAKPLDWAFQLAAAVSDARDRIDTIVADRAERLTSDTVLAHLAEGLQALGYQIELGKLRTQKASRPVLYGLQGKRFELKDLLAITVRRDQVDTFISSGTVDPPRLWPQRLHKYCDNSVVVITVATEAIPIGGSVTCSHPDTPAF
jgi:hypothetical protein